MLATFVPVTSSQATAPTLPVADACAEPVADVRSSEDIATESALAAHGSMGTDMNIGGAGLEDAPSEMVSGLGGQLEPTVNVNVSVATHFAGGGLPAQQSAPLM